MGNWGGQVKTTKQKISRFLCPKNYWVQELWGKNFTNGSFFNTP